MAGLITVLSILLIIITFPLSVWMIVRQVQVRKKLYTAYIVMEHSVFVFRL